MSDYETAQKRRNIIVGIFALAALCALVWLIYKFEDLPVGLSEIDSYQVTVQFPMAQGVQRNTPVRFCGYQVGRVTRIKRPEVLQDMKTSEFYHQTMVIVNIENQYNNIPADVDAKLMTRGLGSSYIELRTHPFGPNELPKEFLKAGSKLQGSTGMTSEFFPEESQRKLDELVDGLKTFINNANDILGDKANKENLKTTLSNLTKATEEASSALKEFRDFSAAGTRTLTNAEVRAQRLLDVMINAGEELSKTTTEFRKILEKINSGQGTAARLINDGRLYENLLDNSQQLQVLLEEMKLFVADLPDRGLTIRVK